MYLFSILGEKPYKCAYEGCDRAFAQMSNLHHHMRNHDDHIKKAATKHYQCVICHRAYTNESSLKSHTLKVKDFFYYIVPFVFSFLNTLPNPHITMGMTQKDPLLLIKTVALQ